MTTEHSNPADWDAIPPQLAADIKAALAERGWEVLDIHDDGIVIDVPGLDDDEEWVLRRPGWRGDWLYGIYTDGRCDNPQPLAADPTDAAGIAAEAGAILLALCPTDRQPCGEGHCICYGVGPDHAECACGCDCPRDIDGQLIHEG
jgi:hypothetical protein